MGLPRMTPGITRAGQGEGGVCWNILGQVYRPLQCSPSSFAYRTELPPGTFMPPHRHEAQDEFILPEAGELELYLEGQTLFAGPGDLVRLPAGVAHGLYNRGGETVRALCWVAPSRGLYALFCALHGVGDPSLVAHIAAGHGVEFLEPPL